MQCHKPGHRAPARCVSALLAAGALLATFVDQLGSTRDRPEVRAAALEAPTAPVALAVPSALKLRAALSPAAASTPVPTTRKPLPAEPGPERRAVRTAFRRKSTHSESKKRTHRRRRSAATRHGGVDLLTQLPPVANTKAARAVREALALLGVPYRWGGTTREGGFDCSGFTQHVWAVAGVKIPRTVRAQARAGKAIPMNRVEPGDLVVFYPSQHHVGLYVGNGVVIDSPHTGAVVRPDPVRSMPVSMVVRVYA